jgi:basic amino acid/polyamine antiporter, APA family
MFRMARSTADSGDDFDRCSAKSVTVGAMHDSSNAAPRRHVSVIYVVMVAVAMVVGAGIFRSPSVIAANAGSATWFFAAWIAGGLVSLAGALCFAELATMLPNAGGDYHFLKTTYGRRVAFLFAWGRFAVINTGSIALLGFVLGDYANAVWSLGPHGSSWYAFITIVAMTLFNLKGLYAGQSADYAMTGLEVGGLLIVFGAGVAIAIAGAPPAVPDAPGAAAFPGTFGLALLFVLFAFSGWSEVSTLSAEVRDAQRGMVRALVASIATITLLYLLANWALWRGLGIQGLADSRTPAADVIARAFGDWAGIITAIAISMATITSINATIVVGARTTFAAAADWPRLHRLGGWSNARGIPVAGIVSQGVVGLVLVGFGTYTRDGFVTMVDYSSPVFWLFLTMSGFAVIVLRLRRPDLSRPFRAPLFPWVPLVFCGSCLFVLWSSVEYVRLGALAGVAMLAVGGVVLWWVARPAN